MDWASILTRSQYKYNVDWVYSYNILKVKETE